MKKTELKNVLMIVTLSICSTLGSAFAAQFKEYPIGEEKEINQMVVAAVYLQPVVMDHGMGVPASQADIHLEADIHAAKGNSNGFGVGEWIPYLRVDYKLKNADTGKTQSGTFMPMIATDGPHYGNNIKMMGPGNYELTYTIHNPSAQGFGRHTDKTTGVAKWFQPFSLDYKFKYVSIK